MARRSKPSPFDVKLTEEAREKLADELCRDVTEAFSARSSIIEDGGMIDLADWFYEQGKSDPRDLPFVGAADLTSYLITQDVDALRARLMKAVFGVRPICFVEGWGADAAKTAYVEAFMDWQARKSDFRLELAKTIHGALIEDCYILEVSEKVETRRITEEVDVVVETTPEGGAIFEGGQPKLRKDEHGDFERAPKDPVTGEPTVASARIKLTQTKSKRMGPQYDPISMKDFVFLPGHAKSRKHVWGYAYRCHISVSDLQERVLDGIYDAKAVTDLGDEDERHEKPATTAVDTTQRFEGPKAEKELVQLSLKRDLDGDGREEWYVATLSLKTRALLRVKIDTFGQKYGRWRCVPFVLFPRRNSVYGYSFAFNKLLTIAEEHTSLRNMKADRSALATNAPMTRKSGALWDPDVQPIGIGRAIDVHDHDEVKQLVIADVPNSIVEQERSILGSNERVSGLSDAAIVGATSEDRRTATENRIVAGGSGVRVDEEVGYLHMAMAEVFALSHAIWVETLKAEKNGLDAPTGVAAALEQRGMQLAGGRFTSAQLDGDFQFEPYGSDENSDSARRQAVFMNKFGALSKLGSVFPGVQQIFMNPEASKAVIEEWGRAYGVRDLQPYVGAMGGAMPEGMGGGALGPGPMGDEGGDVPPELASLFGALTTEDQANGVY